MFDHLRQDLQRYRPSPPAAAGSTWAIEALLLDNGLQAVLFYRLARWFRSRGIPLFGPLVARLGLFFTGADLSPAAEIGPGLRISHGQGIVVGGASRIGERAFLLQQVTIGAPGLGRLDQMPVLGDDVFVGAGAKLIGGIRIGSRVMIGVNAIVTSDVPDDSRVLSAAGVEIRPARSA